MKAITLVVLIVALINVLQGLLLIFGAIEPSPILSGFYAIGCGFAVFYVWIDLVSS